MSERAIQPATSAALDAGTVFPAILFEGEFVDSVHGTPDIVRLWSGVGSIVWDGRTFLGGGSLLGFSAIEETSEVRAAGFTGTLSGVPALDVHRALAGVRQGRPGTLWLALLNAGGTVIGDPVMLQSGRLDTATIDDDGTSATISIAYESRLVDLERARSRLYTPEDQRVDHPNDQGFDLVSRLQDMEILWGS